MSKSLTRQQLELLRYISTTESLPTGARVASIIALKDAGCIKTTVENNFVRYVMTDIGTARLAAWA